MKIDLKEYLQNRDRFIEARNIPGPVITISREYGCNGTLIAKKLTKQLNEHPNGFQAPWKYISKEILRDSAKELKLSTVEVQEVLHPNAKNIVEELFSSFSTKSHTNETKIQQTIRDIINAYAQRGNVIILGQGGVSITKNIYRSLHVKLIAPLEWRIQQISHREGISSIEANEKITIMDRKRIQCIDQFMGMKTDHEIFDVILNTSTLNTHQIVGEILHAAELKELAVV